MATKRFGKIFLGVAMASTALLARADTTLYLRSEPREFIGGGLTQQVDFTNEEIQAGFAPTGDVEIFGTGKEHNFMMLLGVPRGTTETSLASGTCYDRAQHAAIREDGRPGLIFQFDFRGCSESMSRFHVREIEVTANQITKLSVDFVQHCQRAGGPALYGSLRINSNDGVNTPFLAPVFSSSGALSFAAINGGVGSSAPGAAATIGITSGLTIADGGAYNGATFRYNGPLPGQMGDRSWWLGFDAPNLDYLGPGHYPNVARFGFNGGGLAGLEFLYDGAGANMVSGNFTVSAARYDPLDMFPTTFNAVFVQNREQNPAMRTEGEILYEAIFRNGSGIFSSGYEDSGTDRIPLDLVYPCDG